MPRRSAFAKAGGYWWLVGLGLVGVGGYVAWRLSAPSSSSTLRARYDAGMQAYNAGDFVRALQIFESIQSDMAGGQYTEIQRASVAQAVTQSRTEARRLGY